MARWIVVIYHPSRMMPGVEELSKGCFINTREEAKSITLMEMPEYVCEHEIYGLRSTDML